MKILWLIRHAKSSWRDLKIKDFDRPLNSRGKYDAPLMGKILSEDRDTPELIITSPAKRALSTAKHIKKVLNFNKDQFHQNHLIYDASFQDLLELIYKLDDNLDRIAIVGHNPGFTVLSDYLTDYYIDNIPTCGIVKIQFDFDSWKAIIKGSGNMVYFKYPKKYDKD